MHNAKIRASASNPLLTSAAFTEPPAALLVPSTAATAETAASTANLFNQSSSSGFLGAENPDPFHNLSTAPSPPSTAAAAPPLGPPAPGVFLLPPSAAAAATTAATTTATTTTGKRRYVAPPGISAGGSSHPQPILAPPSNGTCSRSRFTVLSGFNESTRFNNDHKYYFTT